MSRLADLQRAFHAALFAADDAPPEALARAIRGRGFTPAERLGIYRNNLRENFHKVLALEFPVLGELVGADYFRQLALEFMAAHPSRSGDFARIGAPLPGFLRARFAGSEYDYFADVAALEWAWQESMVAADAPAALDRAALAAIAAEDLERLKFVLQPALRLLASPWPIFTVWNEHRRAAAEQRELAPLDLGSGGEAVLVRRAGLQAEARRCEPGEHAWLERLQQGATLGAALEAAQSVAADFDLAAALQRAAALDLLVGFELERQ